MGFLGDAGKALGGLATGGMSMIPGMTGGLGGLAGAFGMGGQQPQQAMMPGGGYLPPGYGPGGWPGWPTPPTSPRGAPASQPFTGDLSKPGAAESYYDQNQGRFTGTGPGAEWWKQNQGGPGASQQSQYWNEVKGRMGGGNPATTNNAQGAYAQFQGSTPADTSSFYDRAAQRSTQDIQRAAAATGQLGAGTTLRKIEDASAGIRGQQAQADAQYGLARAGLAGQLASGADVSSARRNSDQLAWTMGLGNLAQGADQNELARWLGAGNLAQGMDQNDLARLLGGAQVAGGAQGALRQRGQDYFGNNLAMGNALGGATQNIYSQQLAADLALMDQQQQALLGYPREGLNQSLAGRASTEQGIGSLLGMMGGVSGSGGFGSMLGGLI